MKRELNTFALKVQYLGATNTQGSRVKITKTNNKKSIIISYDYKYDSILEIAYSLLDKIEVVKSYALIIDNTQNNYYLISVTTDDKSIPNLIEQIKLVIK